MGTPSAGRTSEDPTTSLWCDCADAPVYVHGPATFLDHRGGCAFPTGVCTVRAHRVTLHPRCGREVPLRYCGCLPSGYSFDPERGWWVHYQCGWPKQAWYEGANLPAPEHLVGLRPVTYHEYVPVPRGPKSKADLLTPEQRTLDDAMRQQWVRD